jgi:hypothetical protein
MDTTPRKVSNIITLHEHNSVIRREMAGKFEVCYQVEVRLARFHPKEGMKLAKVEQPLKTLFFCRGRAK